MGLRSVFPPRSRLPMPIHATRAETELLVCLQRRRSSVASMVIGLLAVAVLLLLLALILLAPLLQESPTIVTYSSAAVAEEQPEAERKLSQRHSTPSAPSSAMSRVIAAATASPTAIPVPEVEVETVTDAFGMGDDFGDGWGGDGGDGTGGGDATFFQQKTRAKTVAYVIDFSQSMGGKNRLRESLMRNELSKSVKGLSAGMSYQLIFFAGPAWVAGDEVTMQGHRTAAVKHHGKTYEWSCRGGRAHDWLPEGKRLQPEWVSAGSGEIERSLKEIAATKLVWGTHWQPAIEMALSMEPPPQVVFFMTDGVTGGDVMAAVRELAAKAKGRGTVINTVAMMEPRAEEGMKDLARRTGGQFTIVRQNGQVELVPLK